MGDRVDAFRGPLVMTFRHNALTHRRSIHVQIRCVCSGYAKAWKGRRGAKWVRKLGGGEEDKGGDLLPKLLLTPLLPALRLLAPSLLWVLLTSTSGRRGPGSKNKEGEKEAQPGHKPNGGSRSQQQARTQAVGGVRRARLTNPVV